MLNKNSEYKCPHCGHLEFDRPCMAKKCQVCRAGMKEVKRGIITK